MNLNYQALIHFIHLMTLPIIGALIYCHYKKMSVLIKYCKIMRFQRTLIFIEFMAQPHHACIKI